MTLELVPVDWSVAASFCRLHHRHHRAPIGHMWSTGVVDLRTGDLVGVAIHGRPTARHFDDGFTVEVTRSVTTGHPNANSMLYGAACRASFARGFRRVITYTQAGESGGSLRAAGFTVVAERKPRKGWDAPSRPRLNRGVDNVARTLWERA